MGDWREIIGIAISALFGGGVWKSWELWRATKRERRQTNESERWTLDTLHRSRAYLLDIIGQYRRKMREHGIPEDEIGPLPDEDDPWERLVLRKRDH